MNIYITVLVISIFSISAVNLKEPVCGRPIGLEFRLEEDRIVAGYDIGYYRYPWYAALVSYNMVSCGAALIAPRTILTAAHCYKEYINLANKGIMPLESIYTVKLGVYNICQTEQTQKQYAVEKVHIHDLYTKKRPYYDICLLKLIGNTDQYMPICLPPPSLKKKPLDGTVPGLGTLRYKGAMPCTVHEARLLIHNDSICHAMLNSTGNDANAIDKAFCAGYLQGGIDTCQGDSGGPLQSMNHNGDYILIGIVSFGFRCADPGLLGMYTDVSEYIDWIKEKSGKDVPTSISSFVEMPSTGSDVTNINTGGNSNNGGGGGNNGGGGGGSNGGGGGSGGHHHHHHGGIHLLRPYRRPIKLIIYKDKHLHPVTKLYLHHPIIRKMP